VTPGAVYGTLAIDFKIKILRIEEEK